jgi:hypothetical protein
VKYDPALSGPHAQPPDTAQTVIVPPVSPPSAPSHQLPVGRSNCNWSSPLPHLPRPVVRHPGTIPTGPLCGFPKRPQTDRRRALSVEQVRGLANASAHATALGHPLNALLTVTWGETPRFTEATWSKLQTELLDKASRFLLRRHIKPAFVWTRERAPGIGAHTHAAVHLGLRPGEVADALRRYLERVFGFRPGGVDIRMGRFGANTEAMRSGILRYLVKGLDHAAFRYSDMDGSTENIGVVLGIRHRGQQGIISIKRAGTSQNIGPAARSKAGWVEIRDLAGVHRVLNPGSKGSEDNSRVVFTPNKTLSHSTASKKPY